MPPAATGNVSASKEKSPKYLGIDWVTVVASAVGSGRVVGRDDVSSWGDNLATVRSDFRLEGRNDSAVFDKERKRASFRTFMLLCRNLGLQRNRTNI